MIVNQISDRLTVIISHDYLILSIYGREPISVPMVKLDDLIDILKRKRLKRRLGL